jgi:lipopolysaccharide transport system ATP-binding protein
VTNVGNAIEVVDLWKKYRRWHEQRQSLKEIVLRRGRGRYEEFWALKGVSFEVERGETFGVIGANGSGKSTMLKILAGILVPTRGELKSSGRISALLELGAGFHPELTGRENVFLNGSILGLSRRQISARLEEIISFAGLDEFIDSPIRSYSSGMFVRLGFSVAVHADPSILLVDEVLAVGDEAFQRKSAERILQIRDRGVTILVVSHNLDVVRGLCRRGIWLERGEIAAEGMTEEVVNRYLRSVTGQEEPAEQFGIPGESPKFGSGEVQVVQVEMFGESEGSPVRTGSPATVRLHYRSTRTVERPVFGLGIFRPDGLHITGPNTREGGVEIPTVSGEGVVDFSLERMPLLPGDYLVSVAVTDFTLSHTYDHHDRVHQLQIRPGPVGESRGVVALPGRWKVSAGTLAEGQST